jgi:predicted MFS family arabinose efflux permease
VILQLGFTVGPAVAGVVIGVIGLTWAYWLDVATMLLSLAVVWFLAPSPGSKAVRIHVGAAADGLREVWKNQVLAASFLADLSAMVFGMPRALFPAIALNVYRVGPTGLGLLYAAPGAGALLGTLFTGWVSRVRRQGMAVVVSIAIWGVGICVFALASFAGPAALLLGLAMLAIAGAADMVSAVFRGAILQQTVPDEMRGRMSAFNAMVVTTGPRLGDFESGVVAGIWSVFASVLSGGVLCLVGLGAVVWFIPVFAKYRVEDPEPARAGAT